MNDCTRRYIQGWVLLLTSFVAPLPLNAQVDTGPKSPLRARLEVLQETYAKAKLDLESAQQEYQRLAKRVFEVETDLKELPQRIQLGALRIIELEEKKNQLFQVADRAPLITEINRIKTEMEFGQRRLAEYPTLYRQLKLQLATAEKDMSKQQKKYVNVITSWLDVLDILQWISEEEATALAVTLENHLNSDAEDPVWRVSLAHFLVFTIKHGEAEKHLTASLQQPRVSNYPELQVTGLHCGVVAALRAGDTTLAANRIQQVEEVFRTAKKSQSNIDIAMQS